jgi:hypothetical protein
MSNTTVGKEHEKLGGHLIDELAFREINPLDPSHDKCITPHRSKGTVQKALAISYIVFLYAITIAAMVVDALHAIRPLGNNGPLP